MGCKQSIAADEKSFHDPTSPTVYSTDSSTTYVFDGQAVISDNYSVPEIQVFDNGTNIGHNSTLPGYGYSPQSMACDPWGQQQS
jgi:hypothetical protein